MIRQWRTVTGSSKYVKIVVKSVHHNERITMRADVLLVSCTCDTLGKFQRGGDCVNCLVNSDCPSDKDFSYCNTVTSNCECIAGGDI